MKNGKGTFTKTNKDQFNGDWVDDKINGQGTYNAANGNHYTG